jgi:hypothetical protein
MFGTSFAESWCRQIRKKRSMKNQKYAVSAEESKTTERRQIRDRRQHSIRTVTYCGLSGRGRRRRARRDDHNYYLDWYEPKLVFTGLAVLMMSCLDAMFTLTLLGKGAYEANYFMARLLEVSKEAFVITKVAITASGVVFLLMHSNFQVLSITNGKRLLQFLVPVYGLLILYELVLLGVLR